MRVTRLQKFKKQRRKKVKRLMLYTVFLPCACLLAGYILASIFIIPVVSK